MIKKCEYEFPSPYWDDISDSAKDLIKSLLVANPAQRLNADKILAHPWIIGISTPRNDLSHVAQKIKDFNANRRLKVINLLNFMCIYALKQRAAYMVIASIRLKNLVLKFKGI